MAGIQDEMQSLEISDGVDDAISTNYKQYFRTVEVNGKVYSECQMPDCKKRLAGKNKYNNERHLIGVHKMVNFVTEKKIAPDAEVSLKIKMSPATVYRSWVEKVTVNGRTIGCMEDSGSKLLTDPLLNAFEKAGVHIDTSIPTLKTYLAKYADGVKSAIRSEIKDAIVHVKLDMARRHRRSFLGVNIQYMKDDHIVVRALSMLQTTSSHTGEYLCSLLMQILDDFHVKYSQVHVITTDNGSNALKTTELFRNVENACFTDTSLQDLDLNNLFADETTDDEERRETEEERDEQEIADIERNVVSAMTLLQEKTDIVTSIRCAAHVLQLIINIALKKTTYATKLIKKCRRIVRKLLNPNMSNLMRQQNMNSAIIDCSTRWSSTYYMLERLLQLKDFYKSIIYLLPANCQLSDSEWQALEAILDILKFFESLTTKLQSVQYTMSDFYAAWVELKCEMESMSGIELVDNILVEMLFREEEFLKNDVVYSCVYLDPRYQVLLSAGTRINVFFFIFSPSSTLFAEQKQKAQRHLVAVWKRKRTIATRNLNANLNGLATGDIEIDRPLSKIEMLLRQREIENGECDPTDDDIRHELQKFGTIKRTSLQESAIDFWAKNKKTMKDLYEISTIINAVPATQVTVERAFSHLAFILSALRTRLHSDTLENIILIRLNKEIFDDITSFVLV